MMHDDECPGSSRPRGHLAAAIRTCPHSTSLLVGTAGLLAAHWLVPVATLVSPPWTLLGVVPISLGAVLALAVNRAFRAAGTGINPTDPPTRLVTGGVFRFSRHPMYLGMALAIAGAALALGSLGALLAAAGYAAFVDRCFAAPEDARLARRFGPAYAAYAARVRRWL
jgi:protein-S-isoprenylcysteine O-methyltransferase Ste14